MNPRDPFADRFTGGAFIASAGMLWLGWQLLPVKLGDFFEPGDFALIYERFRPWIWLYRVHLFGLIVGVIALVALASRAVEHRARVLVWPGAAVASAGILVAALAAAFYYHFGAWGSLDMHGRSAGEVEAFVASLRLDTEYVTCLVRFGRVFTGLGLLVLGWGLIRWGLVPAWAGVWAILHGLAAMSVTMFWPDDLWLYTPLFHENALWLAVMGVLLWRGPTVDQESTDEPVTNP